MTSIQGGIGPLGKLSKLKLTALAVVICVAVGAGAYIYPKKVTSASNGEAPQVAMSSDTAPSNIAVESADSSTTVKVSTAKAKAVIDAGGPDTSLIQRLMPASEIRGIDKLDFGMGTYVWEIDMLADNANPQSNGFVYLSADGTKLLNGPMMDKRSRLMSLPSALEDSAPKASAVPTQLDSAPPMPISPEEARQMKAFNPQASLEAQAQKASYQREMFYSGISQLNYISTTKGANVVYVLFDPLCAACSKLYKQSTAISAAYDVEFRWIPIFINEKSYPVSALLQKIYNQDEAHGLETLDQLLTKQWKVDDHLTEIAGLTEADYEQVKPAGAVFLEIGRAVPGIGTPFVMFKNAAGKVEAFGGVPLATDWASLKKAG